MATRSVYLLHQANVQLLYYTSSRNILYHSKKYLSSHNFGERNESQRKNRLIDTNKYSSQFKTLELNEDSDRETVRRQYINLVKKYHPDTAKNGEQNLEKFHSIDQAYKDLQKFFAQKEREDQECEGEYGLYYEEKIEDDYTENYSNPDIKHTAPQHRQYLSNEGYGFGTPYQRQQQHQKIRAMQASEHVYAHNVGKLTAKYENRLAEQERKTTKRHHTKNAMERLVEDLIQESMAKGDFDNLKGSGKPLPQRVIYNPYEDYTTYKVNQILVEGGFAPEWIMLKRDIIDQRNDLKKMLFTKCEEIVTNDRKRKQKKPSETPKILETNAEREWKKYCDLVQKEEELLKTLNKNIDRFNLIVPMMKSQMFHFNLKREADKIYSHCMEECKTKGETNQSREINNEDDKNDNIQLQNKSIFMNPLSILEDILRNLTEMLKKKEKR